MGSDRTEEGNGLPARQNGDYPGLPLDGEQQAALELLASGKSVAETARTIGVARSTLFRWLKNNVNFRAAYNEWREALKESCRSRLLAMADKAVAAVEKSLDASDGRIGLALLKGMGLIGEIPVGSTDPRVLKREADIEESKRNSQLRTDELMGGL